MPSQNCVPESNPAENVIPHGARDVIQALRDARDRVAALLPALKEQLIGVIDTREQVQGLEIVGSVFSYAFATRDCADLLLWDMGEDDACRDAIGWKVAREAVLARPPLDYDRLDVLIEQERFEALRRLRQAGVGIAAETTEWTVNAINAACDAARDCALGCAALRQLVEKQTRANPLASAAGKRQDAAGGPAETSRPQVVPELPGPVATPDDTTVDGEHHEHLVTLQQAAAMVSRSKKTLERRKTDSKFPTPRVAGGGGKPDEYAWSEMRLYLEREFDRKLPERFPKAPFVRS